MHNVLILGGGGREHALCWKINQSPKCNTIYVAPGNGGTAEIATNLNLDILDFEAIKTVIKEKEISMVVVGPELPLVNGIYEALSENKNIIIVGPGKEAAQLEGSKSFANQFMEEFGIPTAGSSVFTIDNLEEGIHYIKNKKGPYVLKADGLAAGKGVLIIEDQETAVSELQKMLNGKFGKASKQVVVEDFLDGIEFSLFVLTNGNQYIVLPEAKDYKRIGEGDTGLNTGGMGAISPVPFFDTALKNKVIHRIVEPTIKGIKERGFSYNGFIFFGLIKVNDEPYVIEYNVRLGDPETEVVLPRIKDDLVTLIESMDKQTLSNGTIDMVDQTAATVMLVSGGYPESYEKLKEIALPKNERSNTMIFHAGTKIEDGKLFTNGGRVMALTSLSDSTSNAVKSSMKLAEEIYFDKKYYRSDIGFDL